MNFSIQISIVDCFCKGARKRQDFFAFQDGNRSAQQWLCLRRLLGSLHVFINIVGYMKVVMHVSESTHCISAFNNATNLLKARSGAFTDIHIIFTGRPSVHWLQTATSLPIGKLLQQANVVLLACENAMRANNITLDKLLMGVNAVPAGILALVEHQENGYFYIKP